MEWGEVESLRPLTPTLSPMGRGSSAACPLRGAQFGARCCTLGNRWSSAAPDSSPPPRALASGGEGRRASSRAGVGGSGGRAGSEPEVLQHHSRSQRRDIGAGPVQVHGSSIGRPPVVSTPTVTAPIAVMCGRARPPPPARQRARPPLPAARKGSRGEGKRRRLTDSSYLPRPVVLTSRNSAALDRAAASMQTGLVDSRRVAIAPGSCGRRRNGAASGRRGRGREARPPPPPSGH